MWHRTLMVRLGCYISQLTSIALPCNPEGPSLVRWEALHEALQEAESVAGRPGIACARWCPPLQESL